MTKTINKIQQISCYIAMRATRTVGIGSVNLGISIDGDHDRVPLSIFWPLDKFDKVNRRLLERFENDIECAQNNLILDRNLGVANQLRLQMYAFPQKITTKEFKKIFANYDSRELFADYMKFKITELAELNLITKRTKKNNSSVLKKLVEEYSHSNEWTFANVKAVDLQRYFNWLLAFGKKKRNSKGQWVRTAMTYNTVTGHMKTLQTYFSHAKSDFIQFENPFDNFDVGSYEPGIREVIDIDEFKRLYSFRKSEILSDDQKRSLDKYLIGCLTGLRKSDIERLEPKRLLITGKIVLNPEKTKAYGKSVEIILPKHALEILNDYKVHGFEFDESAALNKSIKMVASKAEVFKYIKFHSSRDFFAVQYLKFGGNLADLKDILGHKRISTTEIYLKMGSDAKNNTMEKFNLL